MFLVSIPMISFIFACACVSASLDSMTLLAERMTDVSLSPFISIDEFKSRFNVRRLLEKGTRVFLNHAGNDMIEVMREALQVETREEAVAYFMSHNRGELDIAIAGTYNLTSDPVAAILMSQAVTVVNAGMVFPIFQLVAEYLNLIRRPCLIDHLPFYFADAANYAEMFTPLDRSAYRVSRSDQGNGIEGILHNELIEAPWSRLDISTWNSTVVSIERQSSKLNQNQTRIVDLRAGCAVDVNPMYSNASVISQGRMFTAWRNSSYELVLWRGDEELALQASPHAPMTWLASNGSRLVVEGPGEPRTHWLTFPLSLDEPFTATPVGLSDDLGDWLSRREYDSWLTNRCTDDLVLFNKSVETVLRRMRHSFTYQTPRELFAEAPPEARGAILHFSAGRHWAAWMFMRTLAIDDMTYLLME